VATPTTATPSGSPNSASLPFDTVLRGYERRQVDEYVAKAKDEVSKLKEELAKEETKSKTYDIAKLKAQIARMQIVSQFDGEVRPGSAEAIPLPDASVDAVFAAQAFHWFATDEAVAEIARVLKPGGKLICCVPFLQPLHGYPHHYYNMTGEGLRALFERRLHIDRHIVPRSTLPLFSLTWFVQSWARVLRGDVREQFLSLRMSDLLRQPEELQDERWVTELSDEANFELASATMLFAHKEA